MKPEDVPSGPLLLDTDVLSFVTWPKGQHERYAPLLANHLLAISFATVGEIRARAWRPGANWSEARRAELDAKLRSYVVLTATDRVTAVWAQLYLRYRGRLGQSGPNDLWIAACAMGQPTPVPLVTNNLAHFAAIASDFPSLVLVHPDT